jgi:hypothetical protein
VKEVESRSQARTSGTLSIFSEEEKAAIKI